MMLGPTPWLPGVAGRWLAAPIPAARLYILRIGVGLLTLFDVLFLYLADYSALYGIYSYTQPEVMAPHFQPQRFTWSLLNLLPQGPAWLGLFFVWALASTGLILGREPRLCAVIGWICSVSVLYANPYMHTGGDRLRCILLFLLVFSPLPTRDQVRARMLVCGWPAKFLLFQLAIMYFFAGAYKLRHPGWQDGLAMFYVLNNSSWCLAPKLFAIDHPIMLLFSKLISWSTLVWEMGFAILVVIPWTRLRIALGVGVLFHLICLVMLQTSTFPLYSLACYLPLIPWERWLCAKDDLFE